MIIQSHLYHVLPETHKGLKRVTLIIMVALSNARDYSFWKVPYLEREENQSNFVNDVT